MRKRSNLNDPILIKTSKSLTNSFPSIRGGVLGNFVRSLLGGNMPDRSRYEENPFVVESPEKLDAEEVFELFVEENSGFEVVQRRKHAFIWGPRGSGKSMLLRYLEPRCRAIHFTQPGERWEQGMQRFLAAKQPFIGIRVACKEGYFNKTELDFMDKSSAQILTEHMMNLAMAATTFVILEAQFPKDSFSQDQKHLLVRRVSRLFSKASIADALSEASDHFDMNVDPFKWAWSIFDTELRKVQDYLRQQALPEGKARYQGATSGYHDFLLPFARHVQELFPAHPISLYFLIDDADRLRIEQQQIINTWMANRDQNVICIKTAAQIHD